MNKTKKTFISVVSATLAASMCLATASTSATAAEVPTTSPGSSAGKIIAQDLTALITASPTAVGSITVLTAPNRKVLAAAKNFREVHKANKFGGTTFNKLTPGVTYTFTSQGESLKVQAVGGVNAASNLTVQSTQSVGAVALAWKHKDTRAQGAVKYLITATPIDQKLRAESTLTQESFTTEFTLTGLNPDLLYVFSVTPINAIGSGKATTATMSVTLRSLTELGQETPTPIPEKPAAPAQPNARPQPGPAPAPAPAPIPAPKPATRTIYVCPSGFSEVGALCEKSQAYTFHEETETRGYSYHTEMENYGPWKDFGTDWSGTTCPNGGTLTPGMGCMGYDSRPISVRDGAPAGFSDTGSGWSKTITVKDAAPAGFSDNGSAWVQTAAKEAREVPA